MLKPDLLQKLIEAQSDREWGKALTDSAMSLGFEHTLFGVVPNKAQPLESAFVLTNYPSAWRAAYDQQHLHNIDPTVGHCLGSALPIVWEPATFTGNKQQQFYEQAASYGLHSGITLPLHGRAGEFGMLSFVSNTRLNTGDTDHFNKLADLTLLRDYAFESSRKFTTRNSPPGDAIKLTARELECLQWVATGKSSWEVSRILGRSEATVNFHLANIMRKFDVGTRQQAVVKAIAAGLVSAR